MNIYIYILLLLMLISCDGSRRNNDTIRISVLRGPSAIAFTKWLKETPEIDNKAVEIEIIDSPDLMQALMIREKTDVAVLPMINAVNLYNKDINWQLIGCPVWGTLYMIEEEDISPSDDQLYVFGSGTSPDILTRFYLERNNLHYILNYSHNTAGEVMLSLLLGKITRAVLSEPFLSMVLQKDSTFQIVADLNNPSESSFGFPQTAVLIQPSAEKYKSIINQLLRETGRFVKENPQEVAHILDSIGVFPQGSIQPEGIERCKIFYKESLEIEQEIYNFLELILAYEPKAIGGKLPDKSFITGKK